MKEFKINEYLTLKLDNGKTAIYIAGNVFRKCKYLLINLEKDHMKDYDEMESIDEAIEFYSKEHESHKALLDPET